MGKRKIGKIKSGKIESGKIKFGRTETRALRNWEVAVTVILSCTQAFGA